MWFDRSFTLGLTPESLPDIVERLRGTPLRLRERAEAADSEVWATRPGERWSILEHVGHLGDLETLWLGRLDDFQDGLATLRAADLQNRKTWEAEHNATPLEDLLAEFEQQRARLVERLASVSHAGTLRTADHPRLQQPMTVVDLAFFVAEHDDHHLAAITALGRERRV